MAKPVSLHDGMEVYDPIQVEEIERLSVGEFERNINRLCHQIIEKDWRVGNGNKSVGENSAKHG